MPNVLTIVYFSILALIALVVATVAIVWLSIVRKHLSTLGKRVLEFEDVGRVIQATGNIESFESRITGCESKVDESQNKLADYETTIDEIVSKVRQAEEIMKKHAVDLANNSEEIASFGHRFDDFENSIGDKLNQAVNRDEAGLAEVNTSIKTLQDEIENLEKFRTIVEKTHSIIQAAFSDMRTGASPEKGLGILSENARPEQAARWSQDEQEEAADQEISETGAYHYP
jgi:chromosome segregation ATPase